MTADLEKWQAEGGIHSVEKARNQLTYQFTCPVCDVPPGQRCHYPGNRGGPGFSHTGRYRLAASAGLVPPLRWPKRTDDEVEGQP